MGDYILNNTNSLISVNLKAIRDIITFDLILKAIGDIITFDLIHNVSMFTLYAHLHSKGSVLRQVLNMTFSLLHTTSKRFLRLLINSFAR